MNTINLNKTIAKGPFALCGGEPMYELFIARSTELHEVVTEDGLSTDANACVGLRRLDGKEWHHGRLFTGGFEHMEDEDTGYSADVYRSAASQAFDLMEKIRAKGTIDLAHWDVIN